jgi:hypothetical protein
MIKSRRMSWVGRIPRMGEKRSAYRILVRNSEEISLLRRFGLRYGILLKYVLEKYDGLIWTRLIWLRRRTSGGFV